MPYLIDGNNLLGSWGGPAVPGDGRLALPQSEARNLFQPAPAARVATA